MKSLHRSWFVVPSLLLLAAFAARAETRAADEPAADRPLLKPVNTTLTWDAIPGATGYDVYFGQATAPPFQCRVTANKFILETLSARKAYFWRVEPVGLASGQRAPVKSFTTAAKPTRDEMYAWSIRLANSVRAMYPTPADVRGWNYTEGMTIDALYAIATRTGRDKDIDFVQKWLDGWITADGKIRDYDSTLHSLDRIRPGPSLLWMYDRTKDEKYLNAAKFLAHELDTQPTTSDGGYWHRQTYPNQMWLDGIYMADIFSAEFAAKTNSPKYFDDAIKQITLIHKHTFDPKTGLYYHGWDETKTRPWANKETGASPEFWGRAIGWYAMAMADVMDWLPADHPGRKEILPIYQDLCKSLLKYEDHDTAMWFEVVDKATVPKNYVETSCSLMYAYAFAKGAQRGWLPPEYLDYARRAVRGVLNKEVDVGPNDTMTIHGTVVVGSLGGNGGTYDYYVDQVNQRVVDNDLKSVGTFGFLANLLSETANDTGPDHKEFPKRNP